MSDLQKKINQSLVWAEHQARVDCELRGGDVSEHWASIISSQFEAQTEHLRLKEEECKQLQQDKAELVEAILTEHRMHLAMNNAAYKQLPIYNHVMKLLEKHKCD